MPAPPLDARRMRVTDDDRWDLLGARCPACGHTVHPVRVACVRCGRATEVVTLRPVGTVVASTVVHTTRPDVALRPPFGVALVRLVDGPVLAAPVREGEDPAHGDRVALAAFDVGEGDERRRALQVTVAGS
ncbi:hypothetical protein PSU4_21040 [Pseudonocardia sulfidoxydans NBRC 16205]|uniref:DUF35 domain-containing protein n=3 Tax=Pseudonocardia sulfidoxydans TaxID=54011 RepID=A0A511DEB7_9PSEU|nr:hypothetical protein PSU4_21040 [Pseudonocardia sulfidoxydans NBRC 16205]